MNLFLNVLIIRGADYFTVDQISGILECKVPLDYEKNIFYEITIEARDNGSPVMSSVQTVIIKVGDINDNSPQFVDIKPQIIIRYFTLLMICKLLLNKDFS